MMWNLNEVTCSWNVNEMQGKCQWDANAGAMLNKCVWCCYCSKCGILIKQTNKKKTKKWNKRLSIACDSFD